MDKITQSLTFFGDFLTSGLGAPELVWQFAITVIGVFLGLYLQQVLQDHGSRSRLKKLLRFLEIEISENLEAVQEIIAACDKIKTHVEKSSFVTVSSLHSILMRSRKLKRANYEALKSPGYCTGLAVETYVAIATTYERGDDIALLIATLESLHTLSNREAREQGISEEVILMDTKKGILDTIQAARFLAEDAEKSAVRTLALLRPDHERGRVRA